MKLSVVTITNRFGGLDVLIAPMAKQTERDFEVVLIDEFYNARRPYMKQFRPPFEFKHLPNSRALKVRDDPIAYNIGMKEARGEIVVFLNDYVYCEPDFLERHWRLYESTNRKYSMSGFFDWYPSPELIGVTAMEQQWYSAYVKPFDPSWIEQNEPTRFDRKGGHIGLPIEGTPYFEADPDKCYFATNDSFPLDVLKELNGVSEDFCGGKGFMDVDFGMRCEAVGWKLGIDLDCIPHHIENEGVMRLRKETPKSYDDLQALYESRRAAIKAGDSPRARKGAWS